MARKLMAAAEFFDRVPRSSSWIVDHERKTTFWSAPSRDFSISQLSSGASCIRNGTTVTGPIADSRVLAILSAKADTYVTAWYTRENPTPLKVTGAIDEKLDG